MSFSTILLIVVTLAQAALAIDSWVHRQQRERDALEYRTDGAPSLAAKITDLTASIAACRMESAEKVAALREETQRFFATEERLRLERAATLASELARVLATVKSISDRSSDYADDQQAKIGRVEMRIAELREKVVGVEARLTQFVADYSRRRPGGDA